MSDLFIFVGLLNIITGDSSELKNPELALNFDYPQSFYLSAEGLILIKTPQGKFEVIAKTDNA